MKSARRLFAPISILVCAVALASCSSKTSSADSSPGDRPGVTVPAISPAGNAASATTTKTIPAAIVTATPAFGSAEISPTSPLTVTAAGGTITELTLANPDGKMVQGALNADHTAWTLGEVLGYGKTYTATGSALSTGGRVSAITGSFTTLTPKDTVRTIITPGDGAVVGVAAPVQVLFGATPADRTVIEKAVTITTTPAVEGAWAWIHHDGGTWGLDYRPKTYWPANTTIHVEAKLYGVDFGGGYWGGQDLTSDFTIGRNQVAIADVNSHELVIQRDGVTVATYPASYGKGANPDLTTRSGIHVVTDFFETKLMSNPKYGYVNLEEKWAVRISNNGEFIHANPNSVNAQGSSNVTHGCVNLSVANAQRYFKSAMYGDPVEVTGTDVQLSPSDGDLFDWAIPWSQWVSLSGKNS